MSARLGGRRLEAWEKLQTVGEGLNRAVERDLIRDAGLSRPEFTVLAHVAGAGRKGVRPSRCAREIGWDSSRLAHQVGRLERRGLVERSRPGEGDGRAASIGLTRSGRATYRRALGPHLRSAQQWFGEGIDDEQTEALIDALDALAEHRARLEGSAVPAGVGS